MTDMPPVAIPPAPPTSTTCPHCGNEVPPDFSFCPKCGKQLKDAELSTTVFTQIWMYALSVFLPPLGLWPGIKYFRNSDPKAQQIGTIAIVLTVLSTIITIWLTFKFLNIYTSTLNESLNGLGGY
jgi:hypothetical protein